MNRILIAQAVPAEFIGRYRVSQAGNNFCYRLISSDFFHEIFSICPVNIRNKIKVVGAPYSFIQRRIFPHVGPLRVFNVILENIGLFYVIIKKDRFANKIWFYNLTISNCLLYLLLKAFKWNVFIIVADYDPKIGLFSIARIVHQLLHSADGIIALSSNVKEVFFKNTSVLNGLIDEDLVADQVLRPDTEDRKCFLYSGALEEYCGIDLALEVFKDCPNAQLVITGRGSYERKVIEFVEKYSNIRYFGFMPYEEYLMLAKTVDFCLSLRDPCTPFNDFNFPSKIIEFCQMGKVVISTMRYRDFPASILLLTRFEGNSLLAAITHCLRMDEAVIRSKKLAAQRAVFMKYGKTSWMRTIVAVETNAE
jgi:hypothetical protein